MHRTICIITIVIIFILRDAPYRGSLSEHQTKAVAHTHKIST